MLQLYWGDGKGKTTAAMGLALRALGHGQRVSVVQFLKDGTSGEISLLRRCGATVRACPNAKFTWQMTDAATAEARACAACKSGLVEEQLLKVAAARAKTAEVVFTGREPAEWMQTAADYSTEMRAVRHPYAQGVTAREGVEY